ncbi:MAG: hypothetical protein ACF8XB_14095 [Planctomycetota bacterium JB042]
MARRKKNTVGEFLDAKKSEEAPEVRRLRSEIGKLTRQLQEVRSGGAIIVDAVERAIENVPVDLQIGLRPRRSRARKAREIGVAHLSDIQFGKVTESYNSVIASERLDEYVDRSLKVIDMRRSAAAIDELRIYLGGDLVEGESIFPGQAFSIDQNVFDQAVMQLPQALARVILRFAESVNHVHVVDAPGNHGRNGRRGDGGSPKTNWDRVAGQVTKLLVEKAGVGDRVTFSLSDSFYSVDQVFGWMNLVVHGHQMRGGFAGLPWYAFFKRLAGWAMSLKEPFDYCWTGHFHTYAEAVINDRAFLANGTPESDNDYALEELSSKGHPVQRLAFFTERHGRAADHPIYLGDRESVVGKAMRWSRDYGGAA